MTQQPEPAIGERVKIGSDKAVWIIKEFVTLASGAYVASPTREGSNGYTNTTAEPARLKPV
jgi:hypothetical protein